MIYDCFTFFNELDLLEIRLNELDKHVDYFVLVEATLTFQGKSKTLYYEENKERFKAFHHKIIHVVVDKYPDNINENAWVIEKHQRNCIADGLRNCKTDDVILISDVDEIPRPDKIKTAAAEKGIKIFRQRMFYYYLNCENATEMGSQAYSWNGTIMMRYSEMKEPLQNYREMSMLMLNTFTPRLVRRIYWRLRLFYMYRLRGKKVHFVKDGGWHFSYLGGVQMIIRKLEAFSHVEYNKPEYKNPERIEQAIANGEDIFGRGFRYRFVNIDNSWPLYIQNNKERFVKFIAEARK